MVLDFYMITRYFEHRCKLTILNTGFYHTWAHLSLIQLHNVSIQMFLMTFWSAWSLFPGPLYTILASSSFYTSHPMTH